MAPEDNLISLLDSGNMTDLSGIVGYYTKCEGGDNNPVSIQLDSISASFDLLQVYGLNVSNIFNETSYYVSADCTDMLDGAMEHFGLISQQLGEIIQLAKCDALNLAWSDVVNQGLCTNGFTGFFILWLCQFVTSGMLFIVMCIASVLFLQYGGTQILADNTAEGDDYQEVQRAQNNYDDQDYDQQAGDGYHMEVEKGNNAPPALD